jgi:hypothetical protein
VPDGRHHIVRCQTSADRAVVLGCDPSADRSALDPPGSVEPWRWLCPSSRTRGSASAGGAAGAGGCAGGGGGRRAGPVGTVGAGVGRPLRPVGSGLVVVGESGCSHGGQPHLGRCRAAGGRDPAASGCSCLGSGGRLGDRLGTGQARDCGASPAADDRTGPGPPWPATPGTAGWRLPAAAAGDGSLPHGFAVGAPSPTRCCSWGTNRRAWSPELLIPPACPASRAGRGRFPPTTA